MTLRFRPADLRDACLGVALLPMALQSVGCNRSPSHQEPAPTNRVAASGGPELKLELPIIQLGSVTLNDSVARSLVVSNVGTAPLAIESIRPSRFCSATIHPMTLAPGSTAQLEVTCRSDLYGPLRETIEISSNDSKHAKVAVPIEGDVTPLLAFDRSSVEMTMFHGEQRETEVHLVGALLEKASVRLKQPAIEDVEILAEPPNTTRIRGFRIHCRGQKVGMNAGNLIVTTGLDQPKEVAIPYSCRVGGTLEVNPTNPLINLKISGTKAVAIDVKSSQADFRIKAVQVLEGPFVASFEQAGERAYRVQVSALDNQIDDETRAIDGKLVILSNDRTEPRKEVPLLGFGRVNRVERPE